MKDLSALIATHAGDKRTFDAMLSGLEGEDVDAIDIATRRQAFRANSRICGVQAKVQLALAAINTNSDSPDQVDILGLRGLLNLRRIRHNATYVFASIMIGDDDGVRRRTLNSTPLDPEGLTAEGADLIRRFSSTPPPEFRQSRDPAGRTNIEIVGNGVGNESSVTYFGGSLLKQSGGRYRNEKNRYHEVFSPVRVPTEVFILDVLVGEGTFSQVEPTAMVFGNYRGCDPMVTYGRECDLLPLGQTVQYLGRGLSALLTPDLPRYTELIEYAFGRADWNIDQFDAYRCRLEYPVMPSTVAVRFDLAKEPSGTE